MPVITVMTICFVFNISVIPLMVRGVGQVFHVTLPPLFYLFQMEVFFVNVSCNALVYTYTCASFRTFTGRLLRNILFYYSDRLATSSRSLQNLLFSCSPNGPPATSSTLQSDVDFASTRL